EADVKLAIARFGRGAHWRKENLVARLARNGGISPAESTASATRRTFNQLNPHVHHFARSGIRHNYYGVLLRASDQWWTDISHFRIAAAGRLIIRSLSAVGGCAICRAAVGARIFVNIKVVI